MCKGSGNNPQLGTKFWEVASLSISNQKWNLGGFNCIIFSLDLSLSLPNWLRYGDCREDPAVCQKSDNPMMSQREEGWAIF